MDLTELLANLGVSNANVQGGALSVTSPIDGTALATVSRHSIDQVFAAIARAEQAFLQWRDVPAPRRG